MTAGMGPRRRLKKLAAHLLPESIKSGLRGRLFGYRAAGVTLDPVFSIDARGPIVTFGHGVTIRFREDDRADLVYHLSANGASVEEMAGFLELARRARIFFDVGAAKSIFAIAFCRAAPGTRAVALEPSPIAMRAAAELAALNDCADRIERRQAAVGRESGRFPGQLYGDGFVSVASGAAGGEAMEFEVTTVDAEAARVGDPDLLKIDVEGYEYEVILGARGVLARCRPPISLELHLDILDQRGVAPRAVVDELVSHGYQFRTSTGRRLRPVDVYDSVNAVLRVIATVP